MHWIAPTEKDNATQTIEKRLWDSADQFRANSGFRTQECSEPILALSVRIKRLAKHQGIRFPIVLLTSTKRFRHQNPPAKYQGE
jgi:hypothetical protein